MNKNIVYQANKLIEAHYRQEYTVQEQRTVLWLISEVHKKYFFSKQEGREFKNEKLVISAKDYAELMQINVNNVYRDAKKIGEDLMEKVLKIDTGDGWELFHWVSTMKYIESGGILELELSNKIIPYIIELKNYTEFKLENILYLKSTHAIKVYQILCQYKKIGERIIVLDDFREMLGISEIKSYQSYANLKRRVLEFSKKEINQKTDINFSYSEIKQGRKVVSIKFKITSKSEKKKSEPIIQSEIFSEPFRNILKPSTLALEEAKKISLAARTGWDIYEIERQFLDFSKKKPVENVDAAFLGFVRKKVSSKA
jgi:plasmid replication initiation protein